jgi:type VI secretion system secreted protein VgrG
VTLKAAGGFVDIGPSGVTIQGTMVLINSGGAAGSGSGASPKRSRRKGIITLGDI